MARGDRRRGCRAGRGGPSALTRQAAVTLQEHVRQYLAFLEFNRNVSVHTLRAYRTDLEQWIGFLAGRDGCRPSQLPLGAFDADGVRGFLAALHDRGNSRASAARRLAALRTFARYLLREDQLAADPTALVGAPRKDRTLPAHLSATDIGRLLQAPDGATVAGRRDVAILELFYASGLRLSELVGLDLEDVNLGGRVVRVVGKGSKERLVPFNTAAAVALRAMLGLIGFIAGPLCASLSATLSRSGAVHQSAHSSFALRLGSSENRSLRLVSAPVARSRM